MHREPRVRRSQQLQAEALKAGVERLPWPRAEGPLAPTLQVARQAVGHEAVQVAEGFPGVTVPEVAGPRGGELVYLSRQAWQRHEAPPRVDQLPHPAASTGQR